MSSYPRIILGVSSTQIYKDENNLSFYNNNVDILSINNNGNVGIGKLNPATKLDVDGDVTISGNLNVEGDVVSINTSTINVEDSMIKLSNNNTNDTIDSGFYSQYYNNGITKYSGLFRDSTNTEYYLFKDLTVEPTNTVDISTTSFALSNLNLSNINLDSMEVNGNSILNSLSVSGNTTISGTLDIHGNSFFNDLTLSNNLDVEGNSLLNHLNITNDLDVKGNSLLNHLNITNDLNIQGNSLLNSLTVSGNTSLNNSLNVSGNVSIGTDSPNAKLHVYNDNPSSFSSTNTILRLETNPPSSETIVNGFGESIEWRIQRGNTTNASEAGFIDCYIYDGAESAADRWGYNFRLRDDQVINSVMTMNANGNIGIGITNPSYQLELSTDSASKPTTSTWTIISDERIKEDIVNADLDICYNDIKNIPLRRFKWIDEYINRYNVADKHNLGFIAQEVEKINKNAVNTGINNFFKIKDFKTLNKDQLIMSLFGAVKKLQNLNDSNQQNIDVNNIIHESIFEKTDIFNNALDILNEIKLFKYIDKNNNKNDLSEEEKLYYYAIDDLSINKYFNILSKGSDKFLPNVNRHGKLINNEIELYNHSLNVGDNILIKFKYMDNEISKVINVIEILDFTHIKVDISNITEYITYINNKKIFIFGKKINNFNYLNLKFLYSLISFNLSASKDLKNKFDEKNNEFSNNIKIISNLLNDYNLKSINNEKIIKKIGQNFNKLVENFQNTNNIVNNLVIENKKINIKYDNLKNDYDNLKKQMVINQNNIKLLSQHVNKQNEIINNLMKKS